MLFLFFRVDRQSQDGTDYDKKDGFLSYFKRRSRSTKELSQGKANPKGILKPSKSITETLNNTGINLVAGNKPDARHSGSNVELPVKLDVLESLHYLCLPGMLSDFSNQEYQSYMFSN